MAIIIPSNVLDMPFPPCPRDQGVSAFIVPTEDPHMSEYSPAYLARRQYISKWVGYRNLLVLPPKPFPLGALGVNA